MKLWIDNLRPAPSDHDWVWLKSTNEAIKYLENIELLWDSYDIPPEEAFVDLIDLGHDGSDYIKILEYMEREGVGEFYNFRLHSMNPVELQRMRTILKRNGWKEVF